MGQTTSTVEAAAGAGTDTGIEMNKFKKEMWAKSRSSSSAGAEDASMKTLIFRPPWYMDSLAHPPLRRASSIETLHAQIVDIAIGLEPHPAEHDTNMDAASSDIQPQPTNEFVRQLRSELRSRLAAIGETPPNGGRLTVSESIARWEQCLLAESMSTSAMSDDLMNNTASQSSRSLSTSTSAASTSFVDIPLSRRCSLSVQESVELWDEVMLSGSKTKAADVSSTSSMEAQANDSNQKPETAESGWSLYMLLEEMVKLGRQQGENILHYMPSNPFVAEPVQPQPGQLFSGIPVVIAEYSLDPNAPPPPFPPFARRLSVQDSIDKWEQVMSEQPCTKMMSQMAAAPQAVTTVHTDTQMAASPQAATTVHTVTQLAAPPQAATTVHTDTPYVRSPMLGNGNSASKENVPDTERTPLNTLLPDAPAGLGYQRGHGGQHHNIKAGGGGAAGGAKGKPTLQPRNLNATSSPFNDVDVAGGQQKTPVAGDRHRPLVAAGCHKANWTPRLGQAISPFASPPVPAVARKLAARQEAERKMAALREAAKNPKWPVLSPALAHKRI